ASGTAHATRGSANFINSSAGATAAAAHIDVTIYGDCPRGSKSHGAAIATGTAILIEYASTAPAAAATAECMKISGNNLRIRAASRQRDSSTIATVSAAITASYTTG